MTDKEISSAPEPVNLELLRFIIDGYQGTPYPLNRTSLHEVFNEVERLRARVKTLETGIRKFLDPTGPEAFGLERVPHDDHSST